MARNVGSVPLQPGSTVGAYEVVSLLGLGGMGEVYRARDVRLNRDVAIKVLPEIFAVDASRVARFEREAQLLASLNHPHIAAIYGVETTVPGTPALILELVEGATLADRLSAGAMPWRMALGFGVQIAGAMEAAHARGVVHRDLKPANIKITNDGQVKVLDFGIAKVIASEDVDPIDPAASNATTVTGTMRGEIVGTPAYMSPEQARGEPVDKRADIWAFGCVLYEMFTGRAAFSADTRSETIVRVLGHQPDWTRLPESTPALVRHVLQRCLEKDANRRLHDIADARVDLEDALANKTAVAVDIRRPRRYALAALAATAAVAAIVAVAVALWPRASAPASVNVKIPIPSGSATADPGRLLGPPVVSPDGSTVVVSLSVGKQSGLFVRRLDSDRLVPLDGTPGAAYPFWSPDSKTIAFFADGKLKTVPAAGGTAITQCSAPEERGGAWSRQGTIILGINFRGIFRCDQQSGEPVEITRLDASLGENSHRYPVFLPDGNRFLYYARANDLEKRAVYLTSLDRPDSRTRVIVADGQFAIGRDPWSLNYYLLSQQAGRIIAQQFDVTAGTPLGDPVPLLDRGGQVSVSDNGTLVLRPEAQDRSRLVWFDRNGRETAVVGTPTDYWQVALSPDDTRIAAVKHDYLSGAFAVWATMSEHGQLEPVSDHNRALAPMWSADGNALFYTVPPREIMRRTLLPRGKEEIVEQITAAYHLRDMSQAGVIAAEKWDAGLNQRISIEWRSNDRQWTAFAGDGAHNVQPQFSPDGKWLAYTSDRSGAEEVYVGAFPDGPTHRISRSGGREPHWRGDGRELFFLGADRSFYAVDLSNGFIDVVPAALFRAAARRGSEGPLFDVTRDGQRFIAIVGEDLESPDSIDLVLNWPSLIRR